MKKLIFSGAFIVSLQIVAGENIEQGIRRQLSETKANPSRSNLISLADKIAGNYRHKSLLSQEALATTDEVRDELCMIPGHARHIAGRIEGERSLLKPDDYRGGYDDNRRRSFETLAHLPSPETIMVLGHYLSDDRDASEVMRVVSHGMLWGMAPNSMHAVNALNNIGLRDPGFVKPTPPKEPYENVYGSREEAKRAAFDYHVAKREGARKPWLSWWDQVKSGQRTFSFKGQKVGYRFKPDGTWDTIPIAIPPDDGPKSSAERIIDRPIKQSVPAEVDSHDTSRNSSWWFGIGGLALLAAVAWFWRRNQTRRNSTSP